MAVLIAISNLIKSFRFSTQLPNQIRIQIDFLLPLDDSTLHAHMFYLIFNISKHF